MTLEEYKQALADGTIVLKDDEYVGENGLPYCKKCNTPRYCVYYGDICRCVCKCQEEAAERERLLERRNRLLNNLYYDNLTTLGIWYKENAYFNKARITENNKGYYERARRYIKNAKDMLDMNCGLYIYGDNSAGKTFLAAGICNNLVAKEFSCIFTNFAKIKMNILGNDGLGEIAVINKLRSCQFLFIDDFGKEFIGRETDDTKYKWAENTMHEIIEARYSEKKPIIFTSNYSIEELNTKLALDASIRERIKEIAKGVWKLCGDNFRREVRDEARETMRKLGVL